MKRSRVGAMLAAVVLYFIALYAYVPGLPGWVAARTSSLAAVGGVLSVYGLLMATLRLPLGIAADATGRSKAIMIGGALLAAIGPLVMAAGRSTGTLILGRALTGAAAAAYVPMVTVGAGFFPNNRTIFATSLITFASSLGQMIGTGLAGLLERLGGPAAPFYAAALFAAGATATLAFVAVPPRTAGGRAPVTPRSTLALFRRRDVVVPSITSACCQLSIWALVFSFMPLRARELGAGTVTTGLLMTLNVAANMVSNLAATFLPQRGSQRTVLWGTFAGFAVGALLAAVSRSVPLLFVSIALMGLANGMCFPILAGLAIRGVDAGHRSTAMGMYQAIYAVGMFAGPGLGGLLADAVGMPATFAIVAGFSLVVPGLLMHRYPHENPSDAAAQPLEAPSRPSRTIPS
jgi:predicted MFS family arabinose efflux permease